MDSYSEIGAFRSTSTGICFITFIRSSLGSFSRWLMSRDAISSAIASLFGKRKLAGQMRADEKRRLNAERDRKLSPYEDLKLTIDNLLVQMDAAKIRLGDLIEKAKAEKQMQKQTLMARKTTSRGGVSTKFCPQCGQAVDQSDRFCRKCGHGLK